MLLDWAALADSRAPGAAPDHRGTVLLALSCCCSSKSCRAAGHCAVVGAFCCWGSAMSCACSWRCSCRNSLRLCGHSRACCSVGALVDSALGVAASCRCCWRNSFRDSGHSSGAGVAWFVSSGVLFASACCRNSFRVSGHSRAFSSCLVSWAVVAAGAQMHSSKHAATG